MTNQRRKEIIGRRRRQIKVKKLRERLAKARSESERQKIIDKLHRRSPRAPTEL